LVALHREFLSPELSSPPADSTDEPSPAATHEDFEP
jgi:hypothetical protein